MDAFALARSIHVLGIVVWIGGVAFVTTVALPAIRRGNLGANRLAAFAEIERRFVWQARTALLVVGATGLYMVVRGDLWARFQVRGFWWMHAMVAVWALFATMLFVVEPFVLHRRLQRLADTRPDRFLAHLQRVHIVLLALALVTLVGATAGAHGLSLFG